MGNISFGQEVDDISSKEFVTFVGDPSKIDDEKLLQTSLQIVLVDLQCLLCVY